MTFLVQFLCIGNQMISSAIWNKYAPQIALALRARAILLVFEKLTRA